MTILLTDVDEVLFKWAAVFERWIREHKGYNPSNSITDVYRVEKWLNLSKDEGEALLQEFNSKNEAFGNLEPYADATDYVPRISQLGYSFIAITACPNDPVTEERRRKNIEKHFPGVFKGLFCVGVGGSKLETLQKFNTTYWVEDSLKHAIVGAELGHKSLLINRPHNIEHAVPTNILRVNGWHEIYDIVATQKI